MQDSYPERMQFCLLNGIKKTDRRLIKKKVLWRLFPMLRYLYWLPELQWQQLELCLEFFLPIDCCHSLAIFWEEERFFPWLQCCLYFHAFCIYQMVSALRKKEKVLWHMMPNTDMKQAALSSLYGIDNAGTGYQNPAPALLIVIILLWYNHKLSTPQTWNCQTSFIVSLCGIFTHCWITPVTYVMESAQSFLSHSEIIAINPRM